MRLVTWNGGRGGIHERLAQLDTLDPDLVALQNVARPQAPREHVIWRGTPDEPGVAVVCTRPALRTEPLPFPEDLPGTVLPMLVHGPEPFVLIDVWAMPEPTHEAFALKALSTFAADVTLPMIVTGGFNTTPIVESQRRTSRELFRRLRDEFRLISAYHAYHNAEHGREKEATFFMNGQENRPFHLDYCFVPEAWTDRLRTVRVGGFAGWPGSDHRPLLVELSV